MIHINALAFAEFDLYISMQLQDLEYDFKRLMERQKQLRYQKILNEAKHVNKSNS